MDTTAPAPYVKGAPAPAETPAQREAEAEAYETLTPRLRAKFTVSEVTKTARGVSLVTLQAAHEPGATNTGGIGAPPPLRQQSIVPNPKGSISLEVSPEYAASLRIGAAFYLVSA
jgi:hypothetical protein